MDTMLLSEYKIHQRSKPQTWVRESSTAASLWELAACTVWHEISKSSYLHFLLIFEFAIRWQVSNAGEE